MKYDLIYADPAWQYQNAARSKGQWGGAANHYAVMSIEALCRLPVQRLAAENCLLAMWWVAPMPAEALRLVAAWGFTLKTMKGFTWHKVTKNGLDHFGMGKWTRANSEDCLFAVRGRPVRACASVRQMIHAPIGKHSRKPQEARERLLQLCGDVHRVELFAREKAPGWSAWGNEIASDITLAA